jgi:uridine kinase
MKPINSILIEKINELRKPAIIGISGFGGSGKSTFARKLATEINATIIGVDSFCKADDSNDYELWNIMDYKRLETEVLKPYITGSKTISYGEFDWEKNEVSSSTVVTTNDFLIIEGVGLFRPELLNYFSFTIWIDCPLEVAILRGKRRDREEYGVPQDDKWNGLWKENDIQCYQDFSPKEIADYVWKYEE